MYRHLFFSPTFICAFVLRDGYRSKKVADVVCETEIQWLPGKFLLAVLRFSWVGRCERGVRAGIVRLERLCQLHIIVTQRTHTATTVWRGSTFVVVRNKTMSLAFAARCMYTKACTISTARSGSVCVCLMPRLFRTRLCLLFFVPPLAVSHHLFIGTKVIEKLFRL